MQNVYIGIAKKFPVLVLHVHAVQDRESQCRTRYDSIKADGDVIHSLVKENLGYFMVSYNMHIVINNCVGAWPQWPGRKYSVT